MSPNENVTDPFLLLCQYHGLPRPLTEYVFAPPRRYRADYCWLATPVRGLRVTNLAIEYLGLIVECNGGIWGKGGHSSGKGLLRDYAKANTAQLLGFLYLQFTPQQLQQASTIETLKELLL